MANKEIILQFIDQLKDCLNKLRELEAHTEEEFLNDWRVYWQIDHGLYLGIQTSIDLSREIITASDFKKPRNYVETFSILIENKVISAETGKEMENLAKFRNRLIHEYLFTDPKEIYKIFKEKKIFLKKFSEETINFIKQQV